MWLRIITFSVQFQYVAEDNYMFPHCYFQAVTPVQMPNLIYFYPKGRSKAFRRFTRQARYLVSTGKELRALKGA